MAVGVVTRASPMPYDRTITEASLIEPMAMMMARWRALSFTGVLNFEGWTIPHGEISPGIWGEGYDDRRHPHTLFHEMILSLTGGVAPGVRASLSAGKGFAPYGTDDPMNRPALLYPVNHHWSQVMERAVLIGGVQSGRVTLEGGLFNGDEPVGPFSWPVIRGRFGDSWSARALVRAARGVEVQVSHASVKSPEYRYPPAGPTHDKWSASARYERPTATGHAYAMVEWARNSELSGTYVYYTALVDAELLRNRQRPYLRLERTDRPEEDRLLDPFRSQRPSLENSILGISRWWIATAGYGYRLRATGIRLEPLAEVSLAHVVMVTPGTVFTPQQHFGGDNILTLSLAIRIGAGMPMHRMGRYGVLADQGEPMAMGANRMGE